MFLAMYLSDLENTFVKVSSCTRCTGNLFEILVEQKLLISLKIPVFCYS